MVLNVRPYFQKGSIIFAHFVKKGRVLSSSTPGIVCVRVCHVMRYLSSAVNLREQYVC